MKDLADTDNENDANVAPISEPYEIDAVPSDNKEAVTLCDTFAIMSPVSEPDDIVAFSSVRTLETNAAAAVIVPEEIVRVPSVNSVRFVSDPFFTDSLPSVRRLEDTRAVFVNDPLVNEATVSERVIPVTLFDDIIEELRRFTPLSEPPASTATLSVKVEPLTLEALSDLSSLSEPPLNEITPSVRVLPVTIVALIPEEVNRPPVSEATPSLTVLPVTIVE